MPRVYAVPTMTVIRLVEGNILRLAAHYGPVDPGFGLERPLTHGSAIGRAVIDREVVHIEDLTAVVTSDVPEALARDRLGFARYWPRRYYARGLRSV